jgi:excisionase family DNA binding protein
METTHSQEKETFSKVGVIAARLGVCTRTVKRWANEGRIRRYKVTSRTVLYSEQDVAAILSKAATGVGGAR